MYISYVHRWSSISLIHHTGPIQNMPDYMTGRELRLSRKKNYVLLFCNEYWG